MDFASNFLVIPAGTKVGLAELQKIWVNPAIASIYDADTVKQFFTVVSDPTMVRDFRYFYPKGSYGMRTEYYQMNLGYPGVPINVEYDWMFETGFDFSMLGKLGPCIQWGGMHTGTRLMAIWEGLNNTTPHFAFVTQDQATGKEWGTYSSDKHPTVQAGKWYHLRFQMFGGSAGWSKIWVDGVLCHSRGATPNNYVTDLVRIDFASFFGGGSTYCAKWNCYARHANVHVYSG